MIIFSQLVQLQSSEKTFTQFITNLKKYTANIIWIQQKYFINSLNIMECIEKFSANFQQCAFRS